MPPPHKGKVPTKGAKQILIENEETVRFYRNMSIVAGVFYNFLSFTFYYEELTGLSLLLDLFVIMIYMGCYHLMRFISRPQYSENGQILDAGLDLNMEGGMGEHVKDIVILCSLTHIFTLISSYFWLLLLLLPIRAVFLLWKHILGPWFFQEAPEDTEQDEKKRKKMERKMNRVK